MTKTPLLFGKSQTEAAEKRPIFVRRWSAKWKERAERFKEVAATPVIDTMATWDFSKLHDKRTEQKNSEGMEDIERAWSHTTSVWSYNAGKFMGGMLTMCAIAAAVMVPAVIPSATTATILAGAAAMGSIVILVGGLTLTYVYLAKKHSLDVANIAKRTADQELKGIIEKWM